MAIIHYGPGGGGSGGSQLTIETGGDEATSMAVNTDYHVDMSGWSTSSRQYTLPGTAAVGDRVRITILAGNASYELSVRTAASGDNINNVDRSASDWSKLFISGETVTFICVGDNANWVVQNDGRIPSSGKMYLSSNQEMTDASVDRVDFDTADAGMNVGDITDTVGYQMVVRRDGRYSALFSARVVDNVGQEAQQGLLYMGSGLKSRKLFIPGNYGGVSVGGVSGTEDLNDGDSINGRVLLNWYSSGRTLSNENNHTFLSAIEQL